MSPRQWSTWRLMALTLALAVAFIGLVAQRADRTLRADLLQQARLVAQAMDLKHVQALTGTMADRTSPDYQQLKTQLMSIGTANPDCKWLYLMGRKAEGTIFFFVDSESPEVEDASPPGEVYEEVPAGYRRVFDTRTEAVEGPVNDRWGAWISALVPLTDPKTGAVVAVLGMDIDTRIWKWNMAGRVALPVGLMLVLLIVAITALAATRRIVASPKPVLWRLLPPLAAIVVFLLAGAGTLLYHQHRQRLVGESAADVADASGDLRVALEQQTAVLTAYAQPIAADATVQQALRKGDADGLLSAWRPVFDTLHRGNLLSHFYFFDQNRVCLLRLHQPEQRGGRIERFTAREAARTGQTAAGIELGLNGTITLRVVQPIFAGARLIGYVELGQELEAVLPMLHLRPGNQLAVTILKEQLNRPAWEAGRRLFGKEADWDRLPRSVMIYAAQGWLPDAYMPLADHLAADPPARRAAARDITFNGKSWRVSAMPLQDASGMVIGDLLVRRDITTDKAALTRLLILGETAGGVLLILLLGFIYVLLYRTDASLQAQQQALRLSKESYRNQFVRNSSPMLLIVPDTGAILDANAAALRFYGYPREQLLAMSITDINLLPVAEVRQNLASVTQIQSKRFEFQHRLADGSVRTVEVSSSCIQFGGRNVLHSIIYDITERKQAEAAQVRSERKYRELVDCANSIILRWTGAGEITFLNEFGQRLFGYSEAEILGRHVMGTIVPETESTGRALRPLIDQICADPMAFANNVNENMRHNGERVWIAWTNKVAFDDQGRIAGIISIGTDITEQYRAQETLRFTNLLLTTQQEVSIDGILVVDGAARILSWNRRFAELWGLPAKLVAAGNDEPILKSVTAQLADPPAFLQRVEYLYEHRTESSQDELILADGRIFDRYSAPMSGPEGQYYGRIWFFRDITERKQAEQQIHLLLTESDQARQNLLGILEDESRTKVELKRLATAMAQVAEAIVITDPVGTIQYVNPAFATVTGYSRTEAIGQNSSMLKSGRQDEVFYRDLWTTISGGNTWQGRFINRRKDGTLYTEEAMISPVRDVAGAIVNYVAVKRDITVELNLQVQLTQAQKMESVGRLAGGVAHDFNNMLQVILGNATIILDATAPDDPRTADLNEIIAAARRSADLTRQLLAFARKQTIAPKVLDLNDTIDDILKMLRRLIGEDIDLLWKAGDNLGLVKMDPSQLDQILANLAVNARDAIAGVGKLTITTGNAEFDRDYSQSHPDIVPGAYVMLAVSDDGCGMNTETQAHIFEPFFTTKALGQGTGLGLATVYGIVKQNNGHINVYSEPGLGTTFKIYLPRHATTAAETLAEQPHSAPPTGTETVLLVEDEVTLLRLAHRLMVNLGYTVLSTSNPSEALQMAGEYPGDIHLLLTDVVMPGLSGRDLCKQLNATRSGMKCLYMSGYTADAIAHHGVLDKDVHFIQKPFTMEELAIKVRKVLES